MEVQAIHKNARMSPQKLRPLARILKGMPVKEAKLQLQYFHGKAAPLIHDVLTSAVANASHNHQLDENNLIVHNVLISPGFVMKRFMPVSRGMAHGILKRTSHITVIVSEVSPTTAKKKKKAATIETISSEEYVARDIHAEEDHSEHVHGEEDEKPVTPEERTKNQSMDKKNYEAFQRNKMNQQGGDAKKTHRRQSAKKAGGDK